MTTIIEKFNSYVSKRQMTPPRPGLRWKEQTHRWVRPEEEEEKPATEGKKPGWAKTSKLESLDSKMAGDMRSGCDKVFSRFKLDKPIQYIGPLNPDTIYKMKEAGMRSKDVEAAVAAMTESKTAAAGTLTTQKGDKWIIINNKKSVDGILNTMRLCELRGRKFSVCKNYKDIVTHELGHVLTKEEYIDEDKFEKITNKVGAGDEEFIGEIASTMGEYSLSNPGELLAELLVKEMRGDKMPSWAKGIWKIPEEMKKQFINIMKRQTTPPRPGLKWKEQTHRWVRPEKEKPKEEKPSEKDYMSSFVSDVKTNLGENFSKEISRVNSKYPVKDKIRFGKPRRTTQELEWMDDFTDASKSVYLIGIGKLIWHSVSSFFLNCETKDGEKVPVIAANNKESLQKTISSTSQNDKLHDERSTVPSKPEEILVHEMGHYYAENSYYVKKGKALKTFRHHKQEIKKDVSVYASSHFEEFLAELFVMKYKGEDIPEYAEDIWEEPETEKKSLLESYVSKRRMTPPRPGLVWDERKHRWVKRGEKETSKHRKKIQSQGLVSGIKNVLGESTAKSIERIASKYPVKGDIEVCSATDKSKVNNLLLELNKDSREKFTKLYSKMIEGHTAGFAGIFTGADGKSRSVMFFPKPDKIRDLIDRTKAGDRAMDGKSIVPENIGDVVVHEMGHQYAFNNMYVDRNKAEEVLHSNIDKIKEDISIYASSSVAEFLAELFTMKYKRQEIPEYARGLWEEPENA